MDVGLMTEAEKRVDKKWPYLGPEIAAEIAKVMVAFHLDMMSGSRSIEPTKVKIGMLLRDFFNRNRVHRVDHKAYRAVLREMVRQGQINAWKQGRNWAIDPDDEQKLIDGWYQKTRGDK